MRRESMVNWPWNALRKRRTNATLTQVLASHAVRLHPHRALWGVELARMGMGAHGWFTVTTCSFPKATNTWPEFRPPSSPCSSVMPSNPRSRKISLTRAQHRLRFRLCRPSAFSQGHVYWASVSVTRSTSPFICPFRPAGFPPTPNASRLAHLEIQTRQTPPVRSI